MNSRTIPPHLTAPTDILLADVAIRVQLGQTRYQMTVERYQKINKLTYRQSLRIRGVV